jgi:hypothetical protein
MSKPLDDEVKKELEPLMIAYSDKTKKVVAALRAALETAEDDAIEAQVNYEKAKDGSLMKTICERQYAFRMGLYEHLQGLMQTSTAEEHWAKEASVKAKLGVEPDTTPPGWMQQKISAQQQLQMQQQQQQQQQFQPQQRRASTYPMMSWRPAGQ